MFRICLLVTVMLLGACQQDGAETNAARSNQNAQAGGVYDPPRPGTDNPATGRDCMWAATNDDVLVNVLYPDIFAMYWLGVVPAMPDGEMRVEGEFPHARYMSFNIYNPRLEPIDNLADKSIVAEPGSVNPFLPGADRLATSRDFSVRLIPGLKPDAASQREPNTLYAHVNTPAGSSELPFTVIIYRVYVPDAGTNRGGAVDLPKFRYTTPAGETLEGQALCAFLEPLLPDAINDVVTDLPVHMNDPTVASAFPDLFWQFFVSLPVSQTHRFDEYPQIGDILTDLLPAPDENPGGFASNGDNRYIYTFLNQKYGNVAAFEARIPTTPATTARQAVMGDGQLRYWSVCTYENESQRYFDCLYDEQLVADDNNRAVFVVTREKDRPLNATPTCGVNWLPWGPVESSLLLIREMLPDEDYNQSIHNIPSNSPGACEAPVMGDHFPYGKHYTKEEFESLGCPVNPDAIPDRATQFPPNENCPQQPTGEITPIGYTY